MPGALGDSGNQMAPAMPGQQLNPGNMISNANNANQNAMNMFQNAGQFNQDAFNSQMNPYVGDVVNAANQQSWRNFNQQQAPALQSQFGQNGQFGSARGMQTMEQAARDNAQQTNWQQSQLMNSGFQDAMKNYQTQQQNQLAAAQGMVGAGQAANQQGQSQYMLPANMAGVYSGALGNLRTPTFSQSGASQQSPFYAPTY